MDMRAWRRERLAACGGLRGVGLEIGAGTRPTVTDADIAVKYLDFYSTEDLRALVAKSGRDASTVIPVDYVAGGEDYRPCVDRSFDFIIANHVMEHIIDPIAWLRMLGDLIKPGGHLLITLPDKKYSFDRFRDDTAISHLLHDYLSKSPLADKARLHALETYIFYDRSYVKRTVTAEDIFDVERMRRESHHPGVHCHVFQGETFLRRILKPLLFTRLIDFTLVEFVEKSAWGEFSFVLRKGWTPFDLHLDDFYVSSRKVAEEDERQRALIAAHDGVTAPLPKPKEDRNASLPRASMGAWRREVLARAGGLRGAGLEIGAFQRPTVTDTNVQMKFLDFYSTEELREQIARSGGDPTSVVGVDYVAQGEDYRNCVDRTFDFIIANHVFEHIVDVVAWLRMLSELLNLGGHLLLTIPEKKRSFDQFRDDTSIAHILDDYFSDAPLADKAYPHALDTSIFYDRAYIKQDMTAETLFNVERILKAKHHPGVHCHVFQGETFLSRIMKPLLFTKLIDFSLVDFVEKSPWGEFNVVLKKGWTPFPFSLDEFYVCGRTMFEEKQSRQQRAAEIERQTQSRELNEA